MNKITIHPVLYFFIFLVASMVSMFLGYNLQPDTNVNYFSLRENSRKFCEESGGQFIAGGTTTPTVDMMFCNTKDTIFVLDEKKECEEKGGEFEIRDSYKQYENGRPESLKEYPAKITCTKPSETIFSYELTN